MAHIKQIAGGALANQTMVGGNGRQPHPFIPTVDQYAGFAHIRRQAMNMRIVDPQQHRGLGLRFVHAGKKQIGVAVVLVQCAVAQAHFMRRQRVIDALDHPVVEDIRSLIEGALWSKHQQIIEQQTPGGQSLHDPQLAGALQHRPARLIAGIRLSGQDARNGAGRQPGAGGDFGDAQLFIHFVIQLRLENERIFIIAKALPVSK